MKIEEACTFFFMIIKNILFMYDLYIKQKIRKLNHEKSSHNQCQCDSLLYNRAKTAEWIRILAHG